MTMLSIARRVITARIDTPAAPPLAYYAPTARPAVDVAPVIVLAAGARTLSDVMDSTPGPLLALALPEARGWISDCMWADLDPEDVDDLTPMQVWRAVSRHYEGGLPAFLVAADFAVMEDATEPEPEPEPVPAVPAGWVPVDVQKFTSGPDGWSVATVTEWQAPGPCHAARTGEGYWTCDQHGCGDCRHLALEIEDRDQIAAWDEARA